MSHVLITFIGKGDTDTDGLYQHEQYHFENDNTPYYETNFFGLAVLEHLKKKSNPPPPDKLVILGTPSSMWNALYEIKGEVEDDYEDEWAALADAIEENTEYPETEEIEEEKITKYFPTLKTAISKHLDGVNCELRVIPYGDSQDKQNGDSQDKQIAILEKMANCVKENDTVSLDITHGLRHLPMLTVLSAMYLEVVKKVTIAGIYYGAEGIKNRHDGIVPALNLKGLLGIANWVGALKSFEKDGDYGVFAELLETDGLTKNQTKPLKDAAFFERIFNVSQAARKLTAFRDKAPEELPGIGSLFSDILSERIEWPTTGNLYDHQRELAYSFFKNEEYCRAAVLAVEAFVTHRMLSRGDSQEDIRDYTKRDPVSKDVNGINNPTKREAFRLLKKLRNTMAHSNVPESHEVIQSMESASNLKSKLKSLMGRLFE